MKGKQMIVRMKRTAAALAFFAGFMQCSEEEAMLSPVTRVLPEEPAAEAEATPDCSDCDYVVPATAQVIDGKELNLQPGSVIGLSAANQYQRLLFKNIVGTASQPIIIKNCGGAARISGTGHPYAIKTENSRYFRITGGAVSKSYGIQITGGRLGITLDKFSSDFEVDHIEIMRVGFAGVMAKTDPSCDDATIRGNFTMTNVSIHDNKVSDTGGEGFYVGNSFYEGGMNTSCGKRLPHEIHNVKIYNNLVRNSGWDGIQLGCATKGAQVYDNTVENYGMENRTNQNSGVQIGAGTGGFFYNNSIKGGTGNGLIVMGLGDNVIHDNVIVNAGNYGIFCDERVSPGPGFQFINNTIINPASDGIRIYADRVPMNVIMNNIIVNPGSYSSYKYPRSENDAFVYTLSKEVKLEMSNNFFTRDIRELKFEDASSFNYRLATGSPAINAGKDITSYRIPEDFYKQSRLNGTAYDIGASEH